MIQGPDLGPTKLPAPFFSPFKFFIAFSSEIDTATLITSKDVIPAKAGILRVSFILRYGKFNTTPTDTPSPF